MNRASSKKKQKDGYIGIDEVGRGPLAGPITVCAFYVQDPLHVVNELLEGTIKDSKRIKKALRNNIYQTIRNNRYITTKVIYAISSSSAAYIDKHGLSKATKHCVRNCLLKLEQKGVNITNTTIRVDAGITIPLKNVEYESYIKGDECFVEIALASIMAKESRDRYMKSLSNLFPFYKWESNVGYGTNEHKRGIFLNGITKHHRKSFLKGFKQLDKPE